MDKIIRGQIVYASNGEESDLIGVLNDTFHTEIFAELFHSTIGYGRKQVTVRYAISAQPIPLNVLPMVLAYQQITGSGVAAYGVAYSEITGYLWTNEEAKVGGHDLVNELRSNIGKYLHMEVKVHKKK